MTDPTFVDTNVLVCARDASNMAKRAHAIGILKRLWQERSGRISIQVLNEYYVALTRQSTVSVARDDAWEDVLDLVSWNPHPIDQALLNRAREIERRYGTSWWDSMIVAAAHAQRCTTLLSEDFQEGRVFDGLTVRNPFTPKIQEPSTANSVEALSKPRPRHRGRGRPVKLP